MFGTALSLVVLHHVLDGNQVRHYLARSTVGDFNTHTHGCAVLQDTTKLAAGKTMMTKAGGVESALHDLGNSHPRRMWPHRSNTDHAAT